MIYVSFLIFLLFLSLAALIIVAIFLFAALTGAPYVPSRDATVLKMIALAEGGNDRKAADLGSGDGRIVIALARKGIEAHGYEINPFLVFRARKNIRNAGLADKAFIHWKNFWSEDLSRYDAVLVFGITGMMGRLEKKLSKELKTETRVICNAFAFPKWKSAKEDNGVYLYIIPASSPSPRFQEINAPPH